MKQKVHKYQFGCLLCYMVDERWARTVKNTKSQSHKRKNT